MKRPAPSENRAGQQRTPHNTKALRILALFAAGRTMNRFEAERTGDHCLPSTVSSLGRRYRLQFLRKWETVPGYSGNPARVLRYCLSSDCLARAGEILQAARPAHE